MREFSLPKKTFYFSNILNEKVKFICNKVAKLFVCILTLLFVSSISTPKVYAATSGTTRLYMHSSNISEENASHSPMLPSVLPDSNNANAVENNTGGTAVATPCRDANFALTENVASINEETDSAIRCVATFYTPIIGANITLDSTDTNSLSFSTWATEEGGATTPVFRSQLYEYVEGGSTFTLVDQSDDNAAITAATLTNYTWTGTPCNQASECGNTSQNVIEAGNRLVLIIIIPLGTGEDTGGGTDTIDVQFSTTSAPAYMEMSYTMTMQDKPSLTGSSDDEFDENVQCASSCDNTTLGSTPQWTIQTSSNTTTETVQMGKASGSVGSSQWLTILDVKTADLAGTDLANFTYAYQTAPGGDGDITTQVTSTADRVPTNDPRNYAGLLLRFSSDTDFLILQTYYDGTNVVVEANNTGTLTGTTATITGNANNILLRWSKSGTDYQAKYCAADASDCTVSGNWTSLGTAINKSGTLSHIGLTSWVEWVTTTNTQYAASFEWFDVALGFTMGGTACTNEACSGNVGANKTVNLLVNGAGSYTDETDASGVWSISTVSVSSGNIVTVYLDNETEEGTTVLVSDGTAKSDIHIYQNVVAVRYDTGSSITPDNLFTGDGGDDDIKYIVSASSNGNLTVDSGFEFHVWTAKTFDASGGTVTTQGSANLHIDDSGVATLDTSSNVIAGDLVVDDAATANINNSTTINGGDITVSSGGDVASSAGTVTMGASGTIGGGSTGSVFQLTNLTVSSGTTTLGSDADNSLAFTGDISVSTGATLAMNGKTADVDGGNFTTVGTGTVTCSSCTSGGLTISGSDGGSNGIGGGGTVTVYGLTLDGSSATTNAGSGTTVMSSITVGANRTLALGANNLTVGDTNVTNSGGIANTGVISQSSSGTTTIKSSSGGTASIGGSGTTGFYNLTFGPTVASAPTITLGTSTGQTITVSNSFTIGDGTNPVTVNAETNDPTLDVNGNFVFSACTACNTTFQASSTGTFTVAGNWTNVSAGVFTPNSGTVTMDGTSGSPKTITSSSDSFNNLSIDNAGTAITWELQDALDVNGNLLIDTSNTLDAKSGSDFNVNVAGNWTNNGTYTARSNTTTLDGAVDSTQAVAGATTFNNLSVTTGDRIITFAASTTFTIATSANLTLTGNDCDNLLLIRSATPGTTFTLTDNTGGTTSLDYVDLQDVNATNAITATNSVDSGNNTNLTIAASACLGASTGSTASGYSFQRKTFYDSENSRYWAFFHDGDHIEARYSSDGTTWSVDNDHLAYDTNDFSLWWETISTTEYVWLAVTNGNDIKVRRGTLSGSDVSWDANVITAFNGTGASDDFSYPYLTLDSSNYIWVGARYYDGGNYVFKTVRSDSTAATTWASMVFGGTAATEVRQISDTQTSSNVFGNIVPLGSQNMYATFVVATAIEGCKWVQSSTQWQDASAVSCEVTAGSGESEGSATRGTGGVKIDDTGDPGTLPGAGRQVAQTSDGTLYAFINDGGSCEIWNSTDGSSWSEQDASDNPTCDSGDSVAIAIDSTDVLHMTYLSGTDVKYTTFNTVTLQFGSSPETIKSATDVASNAGAIAIDSNDVPHVVFVVDDDGGLSDQDIEYDNRVGGTWISNYELRSDQWGVGSVDIVINEDNIPEIAYAHNTGISTVVLDAAVGNQNDASSFTLQTVDSDISDASGGSAIGIDKDGNTWVAYLDNLATDFIAIINHNDADAWSTWQSSKNNGNAGTEPTLAIIGKTIFVTYVDEASDVKYDVYDSGTADWLGEINLATGTFQDVKVRYSNYSYHEPWFLDIMYSDATDVYWSYVDLRAAKVDDASSFPFSENGRQFVRSNDGNLYSILSDASYIEVWKSSDGYSWEEQNTAGKPLCSNGCGGREVVAIRSTGIIDIIFAEINDIDGSYDLEHVTFDTGNDTFGTQTNLRDPSPGVAIYNTVLSMDSGDKAHIAWVEGSNLYYSNNVGGTFKSPVTVEALLPGAVDITIDIDNRPQIAYINSTDDDLTVRKGDANDATQFTTNVHDVDDLINDTSEQRGVSIGVNTFTGDTWVAYVDSDNDIALAKHAYADGWTTWSTITTKTNDGFEPSIAIAGSSDIYVFYDAQDAGVANDVAYDVYNSDAASPAWDGEVVLQPGAFSDIKTKWSFEWNNFGTNRIDYLFFDGSDVYWDYLYLRPSPTNIDNATNFGIGSYFTERQILRDSNGNLFTVLIDETNDTLEVWKSVNNGLNWLEQDSASHPSTTTAANFVVAAIDSTNKIHIVYSTSGAVVKYVDFTTTFGTPVTLHTYTASANGAAITIDSSNYPHVAYAGSDNDTPSYYGFMQYANKTGGSWQAEVNIEEGDTTIDGYRYPSITINEDNVPEIAYIAVSQLTAAVGNTNNATSFSTGGGATIDVDASVITATTTSIAVDSSGNTWIGYVDEDGASDYVTLAKHVDSDAWSTWTADLTNSKIGNSPSIAINNSNIYVFYEDDQDDIVFDKYNGSAWSGETLLEVHSALRDVRVRWGYLNNASYLTYGFDYTYSDGTDTYYNRYVLDEGFASQDAINTTTGTFTDNISAVSDGTNVHLLFVDDAGTDQISYVRWNGTSWGTVALVADAADDDDAYVSLSLDETNSDLYSFWIDTSVNDIFYAKCTVSTGCDADSEWVAEVQWETVETYTQLTTGITDGGSSVFALWTQDSANPYHLGWNKVTLSVTVTYTQNDFEWFVPTTSVTLTNIWPEGGGDDISENSAMTQIPAVNEPLEVGDRVRIQISFTIGGANLSSSTTAFKLQYGAGEDCTAIASWLDVGGTSASTEPFRLYDEGTIGPQTAQVNQISTSTTGAEGYYSETNPTSNNPNAVNVGQNSEWDWPVENYSASSNITYCFRMVKSDGTAFGTYNADGYPKLTTAPGIDNLLRHGEIWQNNSKKGFYWAD